jgi:hypothetical protein
LPSSIGMCVMVVLTIAYVRRRSMSPAMDIGVA